MPNGSYDEFLDALRAFESGWDKARYDQGIIADWQLDQWAGGKVQDFYPSYGSWSDLNDAEWDVMSYRSMNSLGFVGYQFGEALLIDLGYYDDDVFYGNGATSNTWDGTWTGKNGATSLEAFMTAEVQDKAIQDAFGYNLQVIENGLSQSGASLDDYLGTIRTYTDGGTTISVELSLTGILAAAHLRGAWGTLSLLQSGSVSADEFGTSILQYVEQFGGYDAPTVDQIIAFHEDGKTGDEGLGVPGGTAGGDGGNNNSGTDANSDNGTTDVTAESADVVIDWAWGSNTVVTDFDPASSTIFIAWVGADSLELSEIGGDVVFSIPNNNQTTTLKGVTLAELGTDNFTILDATAANEVLGLIGHGSHQGGSDGDAPVMTMISLTSPSRTITDFDPAKDMIHIEPGVTGDRFEIFEESGDALGTTVRMVVSDPAGATSSTVIFQGVSLSDLTLANFSIAEQSTQNEVVAAIGATVVAPGGNGGYAVTYDNDGSNPPETTGATAAGGVKFRADTNADDIVAFDVAKDQLDFGDTSVHGMILTKTPAGEVAIDSPWSDALQIVQGVGYQDLSIESFGIVGNEHFREDIGGVVSWELGIGPRDTDTVYIRSHEYGQSEVISDFNASTDKISFLYFGTRERLSVEDSDEGLVISSLPTGQSFTFSGLALADLAPGQVEFHFDQVMEDNLEVPFGFDQNDVTLVDRTVLLTPEAPIGQTTDGFQTRDGVWNQSDDNDSGGGDPGDNGSGGDSSDGGNSDGGTGAPETIGVTWNWGSQNIIEDFDPTTDLIDFGNVSGSQFAIDEAADGDIVIEISNNGGQTYRFDGVAAEDLSASNFTAADWNLPAIDAALDDLAALI
ncbi:MAG: hypothetical protein AAFY56_01010 [Pseudomonadota bacterium]